MRVWNLSSRRQVLVRDKAKMGVSTEAPVVTSRQASHPVWEISRPGKASSEVQLFPYSGRQPSGAAEWTKATQSGVLSKQLLVTPLSLFKVYLFKPIIKRVKFCKISPRRFSTCWIHLHLKPGLFFGTIFCTSGVTKFQARKCEFLLKFLYLKQLSLSWNCTFLLRALNFVIKMNGWSNALVAFTGFTGHSALGCL